MLGAVLLFADPGRDINAVNGQFLSALRRTDLLVGWDEIQSSARVVRARRAHGFEWFNVYTRAYRWSARDHEELELAIQRSLDAGGRVFVHPYVTHPPISNSMLIAQSKPEFEQERARVLERLQKIESPRVVFAPMVGSVPGYFR